MTNPNSKMNQTIAQEILQIEFDLEGALNLLFTQAEGKILPEQQQEILQSFASTRSLLERLRSVYN